MSTLLERIAELENELSDQKFQNETAKTQILSLEEVVKLKDLQIKELQIEVLMHKTELKQVARNSAGHSRERSGMIDGHQNPEILSTQYASSNT